VNIYRKNIIRTEIAIKFSELTLIFLDLEKNIKNAKNSDIL